jgi:hypothetical protein
MVALASTAPLSHALVERSRPRWFTNARPSPE